MDWLLVVQLANGYMIVVVCEYLLLQCVCVHACRCPFNIMSVGPHGEWLLASYGDNNHKFGLLCT